VSARGTSGTISAVSSVLIVDDSAEFRAAARALLELEGWVLAGEASSGREALEIAERLRPDVVLLDVGLPDIDGFAVAEELAHRADGVRVVLCSTHPRRTFRDRLTSAPVAGFIAKDELEGGALAAVLAGC